MSNGLNESSQSFFRELECSGRTLAIKQLYVGDVGCVVWDAAIVLSKFLENQTYFPSSSSGSLAAGQCLGETEPYWKDKRVIDLGSGTGVSGIVTGVLGADVEITDLPELVGLMSDNIALNKEAITGSVLSKTLIWGSDVSSFLPAPDYILMADVVYYEESLADLLKTLLDLCGVDTTIVMSYEERFTGDKPLIEKKFFELMNHHFVRTDVPFNSLDSVYRSDDIHVILFQLRK